MTTITRLTLILAILAGTSPAQDRFAALNERMAKARAAVGTGALTSNVIEATSEKIDTALPAESLLESCVFLTDGTSTVILPKGAIIHMPESSRLQSGEKITGKIIAWDTFIAANRADIRLVQVGNEQLQGTEPLDPELIAKLEERHTVAITAFGNYPVALPAPH